MTMNALWWWIDRWWKSAAYMDLTIEAQGAYRNLLDEAWLRGGSLPSDERVLEKACGDPRVWKRVRVSVLAKFKEVDGCLRNDVLDVVFRQSRLRSEKQKRWRNGKGNASGNEAGNT